jgi:hypothetical protein
MGEKYRGGSEVYGEIYTKRWELLVLTNFLLRRKMLFSFLIQITTKTVYGIYSYLAKQRIGFGN